VAGAGIARILSYHIADLLKSRALVGILEAFEPPPTPVWLIYPSQRQEPLKLRAFLDFAVPRLRQRLGYKGP
jgi:DNA-binding transcriptional LysR family regulator